MLRPGFEPGSPDREGSTFGLSQIDWQQFDQYLENSFYLKTRQDYARYARRFSHVLTTGNASQLLGVSHDRRRHIMSSLSALANFLGQKDRWKAIIARYELHWTDRSNNLDDIAELFSKDHFTEMVNELKRECEFMPPDHANYLRYDVLTGLRPSEAIQSANLLRNNGQGYVNSELGVLEHFRFPEIFVRGKKRAYVSVVDEQTLEVARNTKNLDYEQLRLRFKHKGLPFHMAYARKVYATYLRQHGIDREIVDLVQGRAPGSIFARHYYRPDFRTELAKIRALLPNLRRLPI